MSMHL